MNSNNKFIRVKPVWPGDRIDHSLTHSLTPKKNQSLEKLKIKFENQIDKKIEKNKK